MNPNQARQLADAFDSVATSISSYIAANRQKLTPEQIHALVQKIGELHVAARAIETHAVDLELAYAQTSLTSLKKLTVAGKSAIKDTEDVGEVITLLTSLVTLAGAIAANDPIGTLNGLIAVRNSTHFLTPAPGLVGKVEVVRKKTGVAKKKGVAKKAAKKKPGYPWPGTVPIAPPPQVHIELPPIILPEPGTPHLHPHVHTPHPSFPGLDLGSVGGTGGIDIAEIIGPHPGVHHTGGSIDIGGDIDVGGIDIAEIIGPHPGVHHTGGGTSDIDISKWINSGAEVSRIDLTDASFPDINVDIAGSGKTAQGTRQDALAEPAPAAPATEPPPPPVSSAPPASQPQTPEPEPERKVDATLWQYTPENTTLPVVPESAIAPGTPLRLSVHIGEPAPTSLNVGEKDGIDQALPPLAEGETHELRIVLSPKDFALKSDAVQTLRLAKVGSAGPVFWELVAPELLAEPPEEQGNSTSGVTDTSRGRGWVTQPMAELRFSVYYQNQILRSFRLRAVLGQGEPLKEGCRVLVECDFSQSRRFGALHILGPRVAAFSLNQDSSATHTLTLVRDNYPPVSITWSEGQMAGFAGSIRDALEMATEQDKFAFDSATLQLPEADPGGLQEAAFKRAVNRLAYPGALIYENLFFTAPDALPILKDIKQARGAVLQIARMDLHYAFPWPLIYDFARPDDDGDPRPVLEVCRGWDAVGNECRCHENLAPQGWCLRGFWGFRLIVEQLYGNQPPLGGVPGTIAHAAASPWLGVMPLVKDGFVSQWLTQLPAADRTIVDTPPPGPPPNFLAWLRGLPARPQLAVYIGHHADHNKGGNPPDPRLENSEHKTVLKLADIMAEIVQGSWKEPHNEPRSLVFLLACRSGTERVDTGTSLAAALLQLGAVGVLATECTVFTGLVSRMARDLTLRLAQHQKMGQALRETIFNLAVEGCPLGLAFCYLGSANAMLPNPSTTTP